MAKTVLINKFNGLWMRGPVDDTPPDHFSDCLNNIFERAGVGTRDGTSEYLGISNVVYSALYKPNPPFTGTNVPRMIVLNSSGELFDVLISTSVPIYTKVGMTFFGFTNFFGRCYISPSNGITGLSGELVKVYDGTTIRNAGGSQPTTPLTASLSATPGNCDPGYYVISYAFETPSGFITQPATPFVSVACFGSGTLSVDTLPIGPTGTVARWLISTKAISLSFPPNVAEAEFLPMYFVQRIDNNVDTTATMSFFDEQLINEANYLFTQLETIPAGVTLLDYNSRLVVMGEFADPSLTRVSEPGEPEAFSETSGFLVTDPTDNTGVRTGIEFRKTLHIYKQNRGYLTEDNGGEASTWQVIAYEKSIGTEQNGIADILDAKGSSSEGFILASQSAVYFFNGVFLEPELTYKIRDFWLTINEANFYKVQAINDPINKRLYFLIPVGASTEISHVLYGDYTDGLSANSIRWSLWEFDIPPTSMLVYTDFTNAQPSLVTRLSFANNLRTLNINTPSNDDGTAVESFFELAPARFSRGVSYFNKVRVRAQGPGTIDIIGYGQDKVISASVASINVPSATPGREYAQLVNLVSEQGIFKFTVDGMNEVYLINAIIIEGGEYAMERPR